MSTKHWRNTGFLLTAVGFLIPFVVSRGHGMPISRSPVSGALWAVFWLAAFYFLYRGNVGGKNYPAGFRLWKKIAIFISDYTSYFLILSFFTAANFYPTGIALKLPQHQMEFVSINLLIMGMAIPIDEWKRILKKPVPVFQIWVLRWVFMPAIALFLAYFIFGTLISDPKIAKTLIAAQVLVGTTTTGGASNVYTFLVGGDTPLAVMATSLSTLTDPLLQPPMASGLIGTMVAVPIKAMMIDLVLGVIVPLLVGVAISAVFLRNKVREYSFVFGAVAVIFMFPLFLGAFSGGWAPLLKNLYIAPILILVDVLHAGSGLTIGYFLPGKLFKFNELQRRAGMFEIAVENISITAALCFKYFGPLAAMAAGLYGITQTVLVLIMIDKFKAKDAKAAAILPAATAQAAGAQGVLD